MKITEIRKEVIDFIVDDINLSLSRLQVSEKVKVTKISDKIIELNSDPIKQVPMMFKKVTVHGTMSVKDNVACFTEVSLKDNEHIIYVGLDFVTTRFDDGRNRHGIAFVIYKICPMPKDLIENEINDYICKISPFVI